MIRISHHQLVQHVENGCLEFPVATALKPGLCLFDPRIFALVKVHPEVSAVFLRRGDHGVGIFHRGCGWLRDDDIETSFQGCQRGCAVEMIRGVDLHGVQFNFFEQVLVIAEPPLGRQSCKVPKPIPILVIGISHRTNLNQVRILAAEIEVLIDLPYDRACTYDTDAKFCFHLTCFLHLTEPVCRNKNNARNSAASRNSLIVICS
ncbi:hypothetical protein SDC9_176724 [bioreactor metagenome]|uniref:Uncharacterized protein n=1 Tax=bioreactor metagenome TaxID=1076179 RepID=A0A645GTJ5_9ZZZZ